MRKNRLINIGSKYFVQFTKFPYEWAGKFITRGWTQESDDPFRVSTPLVFRLPRYKALVFGKWTGHTDETKVDELTGLRIVTYDDFTEEAGWTPPPADESGEESFEDLNARINAMDGTLDDLDWTSFYKLATESE